MSLSPHSALSIGSHLRGPVPLSSVSFGDLSPEEGEGNVEGEECMVNTLTYWYQLQDVVVELRSEEESRSRRESISVSGLGSAFRDSPVWRP